MQSDACRSQFPNSELSEKCEERDLGICVTDNLKPSAQCLKAANKAVTI